jgi:Fic-DOC domain mobile mystery protein B
VSDGLFDTVDEAATPLTPEERDGLRLTYVTTRRELNAAEQANISDAVIWGFARKRDVLDLLFLFSLHKRMLGKVWRWAGHKSKEADRRLGSDSAQIEIDLRTLVDNVRFWIDHETFGPDEIAIRFHHRLTQIHPFPNGNGRHARLAADLLARQMGLKPFTWGGGGDLTTANEDRRRYIDTIHEADRGDLEPLMEFARS